MPQFAVFEEDMHRLPQRVIEHLDHLLVHEGIFGHRLQGIGALCAGKRKGHGALDLGLLQRGPDCRIALRRTKSHHDVFRANDSPQPWPEENRQIERRQARACRR